MGHGISKVEHLWHDKDVRSARFSNELGGTSGNGDSSVLFFSIVGRYINCFTCKDKG